jgi:hypothetical protein
MVKNVHACYIWAQALRPYSGTNHVFVGAYGIRPFLDNLSLSPQVRESRPRGIGDRSAG